MLTCPHCNGEIRLNELPHQGYFKSHRICPACGDAFIVDQDTRYRQLALLPISLFSLAFTLFLYFDGNAWLIPALISYAVIGILIWWGNGKVFLVPYKDNLNTVRDDSGGDRDG